MRDANPVALRRTSFGMALISLALGVAASGCVPTRVLLKDLDQTEGLVEKIRTYNGDACAPVQFADAISDATFARIALRQGDLRGAEQHVRAAATAADEAWKLSESCGGKDYDGDGVADVIDECPKDAEDKDGVNDEDGCPDVDPTGDLDGDSIRNIDDGCVDQPEDFDGHNDNDGCPETSEDTDGDGIIDATDKCPTESEDLDGFKDADGCPEPDNDRDTIIDVRDACPNAAEDTDDFEDADGCPEPDNDHDGIEDTDDACPNTFGSAATRGCAGADKDFDGVADAADKCPEAAETRNGFQDDDGCPDTTTTSSVKVGRDKIELTGILEFAPNTADLTSASVALLSEVATALRDNPTIKIRIEGHTDSSGEPATNMILSKRRADAVRDYLAGQKIDGWRMESVGFGDERPIDTNRTEEGRAHNRRIELVVTAR
jgi:outer membrane protein OmpA-like peptidoglycan-associated protein